MMEEYKSLTTEALVEKAQSGDQKAITELLQRYETKTLQIVKSKKYFAEGFRDDEWMQEGRIAVNKAIQKYKSGNNFDAFATKCIKNAIITIVNRNRANNSSNKNLSIDSNPLEEINNSKLASTNITPESEYINAEFELEIEKLLSKFEYTVYQKRTEGYSYQEIAKLLGKTKKDIDNAIQRSRKKLKPILNKGE